MKRTLVAPIVYPMFSGFFCWFGRYGVDAVEDVPVAKFQNETLTYDLLKQSVLSLNVYFDQLSYTQISREAKLEIVDLVSGIGGLLGLFLGMSFLSFVEFIEMIIESFVILLAKKQINRIQKF